MSRAPDAGAPTKSPLKRGATAAGVNALGADPRRHIIFHLPLRLSDSNRHAIM